jgi:MYXO-CTERM domain-containing protein
MLRMRRSRMFPLVGSLLLSSLLFSAGCGKKELVFDDDEGSFTADASGNLLSTPYALGTKVQIRVNGDSGAFAGWRIESSAPAVLSIDKITTESSALIADCTAAAEGEARIRLLDESGGERRAASVTVKSPDGVRLYASGLLRILDSKNPAADTAEVQEARVLNGGKGVFAVGYFRGGERLYGHGILEVQSASGLSATRQTSSGGRVNEWLFLNPTAEGTVQVPLRHRGNLLRTLTSVSIPDAQITSLSLVMQQGELNSGDKPWVLLRAKDSGGRDVHGVYGAWTLDGAAQTGEQLTMGDLYRIDYTPGSRKQLVATHGALSAMATVEASAGRVYETTYLGCHVAPGSRSSDPGSPGALPFLMLGALGAFLLRRRVYAA